MNTESPTKSAFINTIHKILKAYDDDKNFHARIPEDAYSVHYVIHTIEKTLAGKVSREDIIDCLWDYPELYRAYEKIEKSK